MIDIKIVNLEMIKKMGFDRIDNYVIPGLSSTLLSEPNEKGCIRLFECNRKHRETVTPHSHRFDFQALVLRGEVTNEIWTCSDDDNGDLYTLSRLHYLGEAGKYDKSFISDARWKCSSKTYLEGEWYQMDADEIHSIVFDKNTAVLFFEGHNVNGNVTHVLEPSIDNQTIDTLEVKDWMYKKC